MAIAVNIPEKQDARYDKEQRGLPDRRKSDSTAKWGTG
jgi:hypothetical protein